MNLTKRILMAMILGIGTGFVLQFLTSAMPDSVIATISKHWLALGLFDAVGRIFVASLKLLVVPLVFVSLVCGTSSLGENSRMGPIALKTIALYIGTTCIAITIALGISNIINPGLGMNLSLPNAGAYEAREAPPLMDVIVNMFPTNPFAAMVEGNMLQIIVFAILFGVGLSRAGEHAEQIGRFFISMNEVIMKMVTILMNLAPYGVFCLLAKLFFSLDIAKISNLIIYFLTIVLVLFIHGFVVYGLMVKYLTGVSPLAFFKKMRPAQSMGFSTASSNATMPVTMEVVEQRLGVKNSVSSFTIPLGATINMDGTAIMQGVATVFISQIYGLDIGLTGYLTVILTATLASVGTAGVPGVGLITLAMVLQQVGLPVEGIAIILGVDRLLDMMRTAVNITGDATVTTIVAKGEGEMDFDCFNRETS